MEQLSNLSEVDDFQEQQTDDRELSIEEINQFLNEHKLTERIDTINSGNTSTRRFTVLSLFSGCGGLDLGFKGGFTYLGQQYERNNFDTIWANEINDKAVETYRSYFENPIVCEDINNISDDEFPQADIVIGGFPCQDFSLCGNLQGLNVERGRLYLQMKRVIDAVNPIAFIAENVKNLMRMENGIVLKTIIEDFKQSGYNVYFHLYNAANYGVPQRRERLIIYGIREDFNNIPLIPLETYSLDNPVTASEAIDDLWERLDDNIPNHSRRDYSKAKFYPGKKTQGNIRIQSDKAAPTIRAEHHGNIEGHYRTYGDELDILNWRRLSVRECARIQAFPDDFIFQATASTAYKQVGNAVPPVLGWHISRALYLSIIEKDN